MRKLLAISLLLFSYLSDAQFSTYHPFPDTNTYWKETSFQASSYYYIGWFDYEYYMSGDTTVNSKVYKKIYTSGGYGWNNFTTNTVLQHYDREFAAIREDTSKHIYMCCNSQVSSNDTLLYDFNLKIGDTLPNTFISQKTERYYVSSIDSILIGTTYRKQFIIAYDTGINKSLFDSIIEGIGSAEGLFENIVQPYMSGTYLDCFGYDSLSFPYPQYSTTGCNKFTDGVPYINGNKPQFTVYPNPSNGIFTIALAGTQNLVASVEIYNVLGEKVYSQSNIQNPTFKIDLGGHPSGVYFYRVLSEGTPLGNESGGLIGEGKVVIEK